MKQKKIKAAALAAALLTSVFLGTAAAQQPEEAGYRSLLAGDYELTYQSSKESEDKARSILTQSGNRITYEGTKVKKGFTWQAKAYGKDGNLYRFEDTDDAQVARVLPLSDLGDPTLDPDEDWTGVYQDLALPEEMAALCWQDKWTKRPASVKAPVFTGSSEKAEGQTTYACDTYTSDILTQAGTVSGELVYRLLYAEGKLAKVEKAINFAGKETPLETLTILTLRELPEGTSLDPAGTPIYEANRGDISDLLGTPKQVGSFTAASAKEETKDAEK